jgi:hypothetical protein
MVRRYLTQTHLSRARLARVALLALFAASLCECGGAPSGQSVGPSSGASSGAGASGAASGDDTSDGGGLIFATGPASGTSSSGDSSASGDGAAEASLASGDGSSASGVDGGVASADAALEADAFMCDPTDEPKDAPCVIADSYGVFVASPNPSNGGAGAGSDLTGDGTMGAPFASIGKALANLGGKSRIYVCSGIYPEEITIDAAHAASLFGGLTCVAGASSLTWRYEGAVAAVRPVAADHPALMIAGVPGFVAVEDMAFEAPDTQLQDSTGAGQSSIAAFVSNSTVGFSRVVLTAGAAANGADGATAVNYDPTMSVAPSPHSPTNSNSQTCPPGSISPQADSSTGGEGAISSPEGQDGASNPQAMGSPPRDGLGGLGEQGDYAAPGDDGADGNSRVGGTPPATWGTLTPLGWAPMAGGSGGAGEPGQGGGGGGRLPVHGSSSVFYFGGAGGTGGCGGGGGGGGNGGGSSVALFSVNSTVTLTTCQLTSGRGGNAGNGAPGGPGQSGSAGSQVLYSGNGGMGGNGAGGSGGGGGSGGVSGVILYRGLEPSTDATTTAAMGHGAAGGAAGVGGAAGEGASNTSGQAPAGAPGAPGLQGQAYLVHDVDGP